MFKVHHTTRTNAEGVTVYAVLVNGSPICADTGDKAGTLALAWRTYNEHHEPKKLLTWNGDTRAEEVLA